MLRQVFIISRNEVIYFRTFGNALTNSEMEDFSFKIQAETKKKLAKLIGYFDYLKYRIAYLIDIDSELIFIFVTGLMDDFFRYVRPELVNFKNKFVKMFQLEILKKKLDTKEFSKLDPIIDYMHQNIPTKIAVVGFAGVGKTTIKSLIKLDQLPLQHIPTISGDVATIQIGKLNFKLFDFAGQDEFKYLWKGFLRGSHAVLIVTDSTQDNLDKSKFFIDLIQSETPNARVAIIGNKQDLRGALTIESIENFFKLKTYPMVANRKENRNKMIRIIADVMDINPESSPLIRELFENVEPINIFEKMSKDVISESINEVDNVLPADDHQSINAKMASDAEPKLDHLIEKIEKIDVIEKSQPKSAFLNGIHERKQLMTQTVKKNLKELTIIEDMYSKVAEEIMEAGKEAITTHISNDASNIMNAINCAFLTMSNPEEYPNFSSLLKKFNLFVLKTSDLNEVRALYVKTLERIHEWEKFKSV